VAALVGITIVYETHSISEDNERGVATGWLPGRLSDRGRVLARELGERRRNDGVKVVFTSDLARAVETTELAFAGSGIPIRRDPRLRECNYGDLNGSSAKELSARKIDHIDTPFPGGESYRDVVERTRSLLDDLARDFDRMRIVLIGHSATKWALDHLLKGQDLTAAMTTDFAWQPGWEYKLGNA
jgi:2,3-bisphosphoglycerate-dependent phosphoglycerate mutase